MFHLNLDLKKMNTNIEIVKEKQSESDEKKEEYELENISNSQASIYLAEPVYQDVPTIKLRDVILAKKFGSSPYEADR